jgi:hypothetical protein
MHEFRLAGWVDANGNWNDEFQQAICEHVLKLIEVFSEEGHSGTSAPYAINMFKSLASWEIITPLTGEDDEWQDVSEYSDSPRWQNKRASHVFKDSDGAYDINGIVWYEWCTDENNQKYKSHFTNRKSRVPVTFPYTPKTEYREWVDTEKTD